MSEHDYKAEVRKHAPGWRVCFDDPEGDIAQKYFRTKEAAEHFASALNRPALPPGFWMEDGEIRAFGAAAPNGGGWITGGGRVFAADAPGILLGFAYTVTRVTAPPTERVPLAECGGRIAKGHDSPIYSLAWGGSGWVVCDKDGRTWPADPDGTVEVLTRGAEAQ